MVRPSILAKNKSLVNNSHLADKKKKQEICLILDIPQDNRKAVAKIICYHISNDGYKDICFVSDGEMDMFRVILK